jgi:hypothetical protein
MADCGGEMSGEAGAKLQPNEVSENFEVGIYYTQAEIACAIKVSK